MTTYERTLAALYVLAAWHDDVTCEEGIGGMVYFHWRKYMIQVHVGYSISVHDGNSWVVHLEADGKVHIEKPMAMRFAATVDRRTLEPELYGNAPTLQAAA